MHIRPHTLALYFKAQVLRSLTAKVELGCQLRGKHFADALTRIHNRQASVCQSFSDGAIAQGVLVKRVQELMSLKNRLLDPPVQTITPKQLQAELDSLAIIYRLPKPISVHAQPQVQQLGGVTLAQALHCESHA